MVGLSTPLRFGPSHLHFPELYTIVILSFGYFIGSVTITFYSPWLAKKEALTLRKHILLGPFKT